MIFHASLSPIAFSFSASFTSPTFSQFVRSVNIFSRCFPLLCFSSIMPVVTRCSSFPLSSHGHKNVTLYLHILLISDRVVLASRNTVLFANKSYHTIPCTRLFTFVDQLSLQMSCLMGREPCILSQHVLAHHLPGPMASKMFHVFLSGEHNFVLSHLCYHDKYLFM